MIDSVDYTVYIGRRLPAIVGDLSDALFERVTRQWGILSPPTVQLFAVFLH